MIFIAKFRVYVPGHKDCFGTMQHQQQKSIYIRSL